MRRHDHQLRLLHHLLEGVLGLAEQWSAKSQQDIIAASIRYLAQASGLAVAMMPLDSTDDDTGLDAPF